MSYDRPPGFIPAFQDLATLSAHISTAESTIENWVKMGIFPAPKRIGGKRLWSWKEVERHLATEDVTVSSSKIDLAQGITNATRRAANGH